MECMHQEQFFWSLVGGCITLFGIASCFIINWCISRRQVTRETKRYTAALGISQYTGKGGGYPS